MFKWLLKIATQHLISLSAFRNNNNNNNNPFTVIIYHPTHSLAYLWPIPSFFFFWERNAEHTHPLLLFLVCTPLSTFYMSVGIIEFLNHNNAVSKSTRGPSCCICKYISSLKQTFIVIHDVNKCLICSNLYIISSICLLQLCHLDNILANQIWIFNLCFALDHL